MIRPRPIMKKWHQFWESVKPPGRVPIEQEAAMQKAFFAGALVCFQSISEDLDPGTEPTDADMQHLDDIETDLYTFAVRASDGFNGIQS